MTEHKCNVCQCDFTDDEGGVHGFFGIIPVSFCPTCAACFYDMAEQLDDREWVGLTEEDIQDWIAAAPAGMLPLYLRNLIEGIEAELKEKNDRTL
jgi:hypothetical protein